MADPAAMAVAAVNHAVSVVLAQRDAHPVAMVAAKPVAATAMAVAIVANAHNKAKNVAMYRVSVPTSKRWTPAKFLRMLRRSIQRMSVAQSNAQNAATATNVVNVATGQSAVNAAHADRVHKTVKTSTRTTPTRAKTRLWQAMLRPWIAKLVSHAPRV